VLIGVGTIGVLSSQEGAVVAIDEAAIRELAGFKGDSAPVTTCYLNVDGRRLPRYTDCERQLDRLVRQAPEEVNRHRSVTDDLRRISSFVRNGFDRSHTRGLAFFSCSAMGLWRVVELPVPVRDQLVVNALPAVGQLERVVQEFDRIGVLLVDRQRVRMFVFEFGELIDRSELFDELPRDYDTRGERERGDTRPHVRALAAQHLRRAAHVAWRVFGEESFDHLCIGAPPETVQQLESDLHPYLRDRLRGHIAVDVGAPLSEIRDAVLAFEIEIERQHEATVVARLRESVATATGVAGIDDSLAALAGRRVDTLLVSQGFSQAGWRCARCLFLATVGRSCPTCGDDMESLGDVVEEAVEEALAQSCTVEICVGNADLDVLGRIGAQLRF
jgi:peptide subunit release factor 1 (eRF1)